MSKSSETLRTDLAWLFGACESEMGIKSSFGTFIRASQWGAARARVDGDTGDLTNGAQEELEGEDAFIEALDARRAAARLLATARNRRIMAAYHQLDVTHQRVLEAAYAARQYPPEVRQAFGELAGVAPLTATARALPAWSWEWLARAALRPVGRTVKAEAETLLGAALRAFESVRP